MASSSSCTAPPGETLTTRAYPVSLVLTVRSSLISSPLINSCVSRINALLSLAHVPEKSHLTPEEFVLSGAAVVATLLLYYVMFGKRHRKRRKELARELRLAQMQVRACRGPNDLCAEMDRGETRRPAHGSPWSPVPSAEPTLRTDA